MKGFPTTEGLIDDDDEEDDQTIILLIPNKEASSGFNVGLPRYQWSPVLVLLFPLCVCVSTQYFSTHTGLCVWVSTFQDPQYFSTLFRAFNIAGLPISRFSPLKSNSPFYLSEWNACVNGRLRDCQISLSLFIGTDDGTKTAFDPPSFSENHVAIFFINFLL